MKLIFMKNWRWLTSCMILGLLLSSCKDDDNASREYNPNEEVVLTSFNPTKGPLASQVILYGSNFGNNKEIVKVFFNEKEANVVSAVGNKILVLAPRLPGEECVIKVQVGEQERTYKEAFDYIIQTNVTTLVGGVRSDANPRGTVSLSEAQFRNKVERPLAIDEEKNIYFDVNDKDNDWDCYIMNEEANQIKWLETGGYWLNAPVVAYSPLRGTCYKMYANSGSHDYFYYDKKMALSKVQEGKIAWLNGIEPKAAPGFGTFSDKQTFAMNPDDGKFYTRNYVGEILRFDPATGIGEVLNPSPNVVGAEGNSFGFIFDKFDNNIIYFSVEQAHCIYKYVLSTGECTLLAGKEKTGGFMDGPLGNSRFSAPKQICTDSEGDLYVADRDNHCIRKITMKTGYVSTVAGIPQKAGYQNGTSEVALLNQPVGLVIDSDDIMYIGDSENAAIRRLAIE
ncbi:IPT/TIG domain-containing protein [Bacteroides thetaiotaomicron]|uniref:IPT/TIG domain-containing protein n=1 Tax=Bacteroides thetaiotaomicron TaxID=818 RepID=UPI002166B239|nr:IPT/TIG domain-containing protein [Bacteroides thetaiotaomicron]MCS3195415.1 IPT/TIG domain-containing protein [Bacteroides thetaiotaomicron]